MEPQAKKRRIGLAHTASGAPWSSGGPPREYLQPQSSSSDFAGTGFSNNNGNFNVGGNLYLNNGTTANTTSTPPVGRVELLDSLRFEQIESRQLSIKKAHENTCRWFLTDPIYKQWEKKAKLQENENLLWIKGKPGAGKSTLMNYLDKQLRSRLRKKGGSCAFISFFFNARGSDLEKSIEGMYRSLLVQLLDACPELQHVLDRLRSIPKWDVGLLKHLFEQAAEGSTTTICLIDALDEGLEKEIRAMVESFESILRAGSQLHVCFASRHYPHISTQMGLSITLEEQDQHENDISSYLNTKLNIGHSEQAEKIRLEMREKASGVFMWVVLVVEMLNKEFDKGKIPNLRKRLRQIPSDLHELFHSILVRDNADRDELLLCIQWVLFAKEPLTPKQLYFAIISGSDLESLLDYHSEDISETDMQRYILNSSKGLTEPTKSKKTPTIQFIHESVRDFLLKGDGFCYEEFCELWSPVLAISDGSKPFNNRFTFSFDRDRPRLTELSRCGGELVSIFYLQTESFDVHTKDNDGYTAMMVAAENGYTHLLKELHQRGIDVANASLGGLTALHVAAENHQLAAVKQLINFGASVSVVDAVQKTPLHYLGSAELDTWNDAVNIARTLIDNGARVSCMDTNGETPLHMVSMNRHGCELAKLLLDCGANIAAADNEGSTPLHCWCSGDDPIRDQIYLRQRSKYKSIWAVSIPEEYLNMGRLLLNRGGDVASIDKHGQTPLHYCHDRETAELLLDHNACISAIDASGDTPLHCAASDSEPYLCQLLLDRGADPMALNKSGNIPFDVMPNRRRGDCASLQEWVQKHVDKYSGS
ncbi:hypothetical protein E8E14_014618 [Neopestalotiopsis sp. 37M]|nr:hypothetical protein E8E14_014618 [Neopestalotiopsis sp. 37M]